MDQNSLVFKSTRERTNDHPFRCDGSVFKQILLSAFFSIIIPCFFYLIVYCSSNPNASFVSFFGQPDFFNLMACLDLSLFLQFLWKQEKTKALYLLQGVVGLIAGLGFLGWSFLVFEQDNYDSWLFALVYFFVTFVLAIVFAAVAAQNPIPKSKEDNDQ